MNYMPSFATTPSEAAVVARHSFVPPTPAGDEERESAPFWTPTRIDTARRLWGKGVDEEDIIAALRRLPGPQEMSAQAIAALAHRLCWPSPKQTARPTLLRTRDGLPSMAERQAAELARTLDVVELPLEDALAWGRANGVLRLKAGDESETESLARINRARAGYSLPRFQVSRRP